MIQSCPQFCGGLQLRRVFLRAPFEALQTFQNNQRECPVRPYDWNSWLRYETQDDSGTPNPLAHYITRIYTEIASQPGRMFNDFRYLGFNEDESGRKVFDGHMQWISAGSGIGMNYRFSQSRRTERNLRRRHAVMALRVWLSRQTERRCIQCWRVR